MNPVPRTLDAEIPNPSATTVRPTTIPALGASLRQELGHCAGCGVTYSHPTGVGFIRIVDSDICRWGFIRFGFVVL